MYMKTAVSDYWLTKETKARLQRKEVDPILLASLRRSIADFVRIVSGKNIPVRYKLVKDGDSYTDSKSITISSDFSDMDVVVGLALHEGTHISETDFSYFANEGAKLKQFVNTNLSVQVTNYLARTGITQRDFALLTIAKRLHSMANWIEDRRIDNIQLENAPGYYGYYEAFYKEYFHHDKITAVLQSKDARIENWFSYEFRVINLMNVGRDLTALKGLQEIWDVLDLRNIARLKDTTDSLYLAVQILKIIDKYIEEQKYKKEEKKQGPSQKQKDQDEKEKGEGTPQESENEDDEQDDNDQDGEPTPSKSKARAKKEKDDTEDTEEDDDSGDDTDDTDDTDSNKSKGKGKKEKDEDTEEDTDSEEDNETSGTSEDTDSEEEKDNEKSNSTETDNKDGDEEVDETPEEVVPDEPKSNEQIEEDEQLKEIQEALDSLTPEEINDLLDILERQKSALDGEIKKTGITDKTQSIVESLAEAGTDSVKTGVGLLGYDAKVGVDNQQDNFLIETIVIQNLTKNLIESRAFECFTPAPYYTEVVEKGIELGKKLAKKLQVMNEERETVYNRKEKGKLDRNRVHALGYESNTVFYTKEIDFCRPVLVYISIDGSGSMSGVKWENAQIAAIAIAQAAEMIPNLNVVITYRFSTAKSDKQRPLMLIAYDSRKDNISKIKTLFPFLRTCGYTPEGLCFEAVQREISQLEKNSNAFFINFSDGQPEFSSTDDKSNGYFTYNGLTARRHTRREVDKISAKGIQVLSFFIEQGNNYSNIDAFFQNEFKMMYGKNAAKISVTDILPLTAELNKMFIQKDTK